LPQPVTYTRQKTQDVPVSGLATGPVHITLNNLQHEKYDNIKGVILYVLRVIIVDSYNLYVLKQIPYKTVAGIYGPSLPV
jgi:hypothetical protein